VLFERAMIELSSFTASVTLLAGQPPVSHLLFLRRRPLDSHKLVGLLLLFEDCGGGIIFLREEVSIEARLPVQARYDPQACAQRQKYRCETVSCLERQKSKINKN
jgi:hypothetical protein